MATKAEPKGLIQKLVEVMGLMRAIEKKGFNKNQRYSFVRESDVAEKASELLSERGVFLRQTVVESETFQQYETSSGSIMWLTRVVMEFQFIDANGETLEPVRFHGAGSDTGDKGVYKAMTGAEKYFLMKTFLISTGDDPEADEKVDKEAASRGAKRGAKVKGKASTTAKRGGKTDGISSAQIKAITDLVKEKGLDATGFIGVVVMQDVEVEEGADANKVLTGLSSEQAGKVIRALDEMESSGEVGGQDVEQEAMSIV